MTIRKTTLWRAGLLIAHVSLLCMSAFCAAPYIGMGSVVQRQSAYFKKQAQRPQVVEQGGMRKALMGEAGICPYAASDFVDLIQETRWRRCSYEYGIARELQASLPMMPASILKVLWEYWKDSNVPECFSKVSCPLVSILAYHLFNKARIRPSLQETVRFKLWNQLSIKNAKSLYDRSEAHYKVWQLILSLLNEPRVDEDVLYRLKESAERIYHSSIGKREIYSMDHMMAWCKKSPVACSAIFKGTYSRMILLPCDATSIPEGQPDSLPDDSYEISLIQKFGEDAWPDSIKILDVAFFNKSKPLTSIKRQLCLQDREKVRHTLRLCCYVAESTRLHIPLGDMWEVWEEGVRENELFKKQSLYTFFAENKGYCAGYYPETSTPEMRQQMCQPMKRQSFSCVTLFYIVEKSGAGGK